MGAAFPAASATVSRRLASARHSWRIPEALDVAEMASSTEVRERVGLILVVDDDARNREVLVSYLSRAGHRVVAAASGEEALAVAVAATPDLVILDVLMHGSDGYEVTRRLKRTGSADFLPVIVVTALDDVSSRVAGYEAGADEFLAKPIYRAELLTRVASLLALREERREVARRNVELLELQRYKENLTQLLVHDLKNPLSVLAANLEYSRQELRHEGRADLLDALDDSVSACSRLQRMLSNLLDVGRLEEGGLKLSLTPIALRPLMTALVRAHGRAALERNVQLTVDSEEIGIRADADLLSRVLENLIEGLLRFVPRGGLVCLKVRRMEGYVRFAVESDAPSVAPEMRGRLFDKYGAVEVLGGNPRVSRGLGLYFCRLAVEAHGGHINVEDHHGCAVFVFELPIAAP